MHIIISGICQLWEEVVRLVSRPSKYRRICASPEITSYKPCVRGAKALLMSLDEYEALRLIDYRGMTQEQCARQMDIARTTVQSIYAVARKKLARCIAEVIRRCRHRLKYQHILKTIWRPENENSSDI